MTDNPLQKLVSPLTEANPDSLSELFSRDPLELTREDRNVIVAELRKQRERFATSEANKPERKAKPKLTQAPSNLSLKDIGLG